MSGAVSGEGKSADAGGEKSKGGRHSRRGSFSDTLGNLGRHIARSVSSGSIDGKEKKKKKKKTKTDKKAKKKDKLRGGGGDDDDSSSSSTSSSSAHPADKSMTPGGRSDAEEEDLLLDGTHEGGRALDAHFASSTSLPELPTVANLLDSPRSQTSQSGGKKRKSKGTIGRDDLDEMLRAQRAALQDIFTESLAPLRMELGRLKEQQATTALVVQTLQTLRSAPPLVGTGGRTATPQPSPTHVRASSVAPGGKTTHSSTLLDETVDADFKRNPGPRKTAFCGCCCQ
jgi:hypothetical protein